MVETIGLIILALAMPLYALIGVRIGQASKSSIEDIAPLKTQPERPQPQKTEEGPEPVMDTETAKIMDEWLNGGGK